MSVKTTMNTPISIKNEKAQREPAGRAGVGGSGVTCCGRGAGEGTGSSGLGERQLAARCVIVEKLRIAAPLNGRFQLPPRFIVAEMFVQQILEELRGKRAVGFCFQGLLHLAQQWNIRQHGLAENRLALLNVRIRK